MTRMSLLGVPGRSSKLVDCTKALPGGTGKGMLGLRRLMIGEVDDGGVRWWKGWI